MAFRLKIICYFKKLVFKNRRCRVIKNKNGIQQRQDHFELGVF